MAGSKGESMATHRLRSDFQREGSAEPEHLAAGLDTLFKPDDGGDFRAAPPLPPPLLPAAGPVVGAETPPGVGAAGEEGALLDVLSSGSKNHFGDKCHPCRHTTSGGRCPRGAKCNCCHYYHGPEKFRAMKEFALSYQSKKMKKRMDACKQAANAWIGAPPGLAQPPLRGSASYFPPPTGLQFSAGGFGLAVAMKEPVTLPPGVMANYGQWGYAPEHVPIADLGVDLLEPAYITSDCLSKPLSGHEPFCYSIPWPSFS